MKGISRALGAVGRYRSALVDGKFDPDSFLAGAFPKLFGLFSLLDLLGGPGLDAAPAFVSDALDAVTRLVTEAQRLKAAPSPRRRHGSAGDRERARTRGASRRATRQGRARRGHRAAKDHLDA